MYYTYTKIKKSDVVSTLTCGWNDKTIAYCGSKLNPYLLKNQLSTIHLSFFSDVAHFNKWTQREKEKLCDEIRGLTLNFYLVSESDTKYWVVEEIREKLQKNNEMVLKGVLLLYSLQSHEEMTYRECTRANGIGFNKVDIEFMSSIAEQIMVKGNLTPKQMDIVRKRILKYATQLTSIANGELQANKDILRKLKKS